MKKAILIFVALLSLSFGTLVSAQGQQGLKGARTVLENIGGQNGEKLGVSADLSTSIATVIKAVLSLLGTIFLALTIYAGILWMTAAGNDEQVTKATGILKMAVVGLVIIMSAYAITYFVTSKLGNLSTSSSLPEQSPLPLGMSCEFDKECDSMNCQNNKCERQVIDL